jgi:hypothetical protein
LADPSSRLLSRETESIVEAVVEAGKPCIPALKRPAVKSARIAASLSFSVEAKKKAAARAVAEFARTSSAEPRHFICCARIVSSITRGCDPLEFKAPHRSRLSPG